MKNKNAFSIIEVVIATWIISITLFWIYKIIWENNKIIANSNNFLTQNFLYENAYECLKSQNFTEKKFLNFWNDLKSCNFTNDEKITKIDNVEYIISAKWTEKNWKIIFWKIIVESNILWKSWEKTFKN